MIEGMAFVSDLVAYYASVEELYLSRMASVGDNTLSQLKASLVKLYASILTFLGTAYAYYRRKQGSDRLKGILSKIFANGAASIDELTNKIARDENSVDRLLRLVKDQNDINGSSLMDDALQDIRSQTIRQAANLEHSLLSWKSDWKDTESGISEIVHSVRTEQSKKVLEWLSVLEIYDEHEKVTRDRLGESGEWLFEDEAYRSWRNSSTSSIIWLSGTLGMGKTKLVSSVIDRLKDDYRSSFTNEPVAYFYCQRNETTPAFANPDEMFCSIVRQLFETSPEMIGNEVNEAYERRKAEPGGLRRLRVEECVSMIVAFAMKSSLTLIIDALDECDRQRLHEVTKGLRDISQRSPLHVKIFVSSRSDLRINILSHALNFYVDVHNNRKDIRRFIRFKVDEMISDMRITIQDEPVSDGTRNSMVQTLEERAQGMLVVQRSLESTLD